MTNEMKLILKLCDELWCDVESKSLLENTQALSYKLKKREPVDHWSASISYSSGDKFLIGDEEFYVSEFGAVKYPRGNNEKV